MITKGKYAKGNEKKISIVFRKVQEFFTQKPTYEELERKIRDLGKGYSSEP